ncbi:hypothetical protein DXG01_008278 [Tephrocybe rancida]|nr:hypothetical protein DXG01_008278 [Tephrocybe rancida]
MHDTFTDPTAEGIFSTTALRETAGAYIREQVKAHKLIIRYYHQRLNALSFTCRLPPEILATIFGQLVESAHYDVHHKYHHGEYLTHKVPNLNWIPQVSHVCSHWREVALSAPYLWSRIPIDDPSWATEMLQRSKAVPLRISYRGPLYGKHGSDVESAHMILETVLCSQMARVKTLTLELPHVGFGEKTMARGRFAKLLSMLKQPAPMLERLQIRSPFAAANMPESNSLPDGMAAGCQRLTHLDLDGCSVAWEASAFRHLKVLSITSLPVISRPSVTQLVALLSQTPLLESLSIDNMQKSPGTVPLQTSTVILDRLEDLSFGGDLPSCTSLFDHLTVSRHARKILLRLTSVPPNDSSTTSLMKSLAQKLDHDIAGTASKLELVDGIRYWKSNDLQMPEEAPTVLISILFPIDSFPGRVAFLQSLSLDQLQSLKIHSSNIEDDALLGFSDLPNLKSLRITSHEFRLLTILGRGMGTKRNAPVLRPSFTALKNLTIVNWAMDLTQRGKDVGKSLATCFRARKKAGFYLELLELDDCTTVDEEDLARLRKCIKKVDWDGIGEVEEDSDDEEYECEACGEIHH